MAYSLPSVSRSLPGTPLTSAAARGVSRVKTPESGILSSVLSPLSKAMNVLDLPVSVVRDVLAFENPIDQFATPTTQENRTSSRQLLTKYLGVKPNDPDKWEVADFAAFGLDIALDPLTWLMFGGNAVLTGAGKATMAARAAVLGREFKAGETTIQGAVKAAKVAAGFDTTITGAVRRGERGLAAFHVPFTSKFDKPLFTGAKAARVPELFGKLIGDPLKSTGITKVLRSGVDAAQRHGRALFSAPVMGTVGRTAQKLTPNLYESIMGANRQARSAVLDIGLALDENAKHLLKNTIEAKMELRDIMEGYLPYPKGTEGAFGRFRKLDDSSRAAAMNIGKLPDDHFHLFRSGSHHNAEQRMGQILSNAASDPSKFARKDFIADARTSGLMRAASDPDTVDIAGKFREAVSRRDSFNITERELGDRFERLSAAAKEALDSGDQAAFDSLNQQIADVANQSTELEKVTADVEKYPGKMLQHINENFIGKTGEDGLEILGPTYRKQVKPVDAKGERLKGKALEAKKVELRQNPDVEQIGEAFFTKHERAPELADWFLEHDPEVLSKGIFDTHPIADAEFSMTHRLEGVQSIAHTLQALSSKEIVKDAFSRARNPEDVVTVGGFLTAGNRGFDKRRSAEAILAARGQDITDPAVARVLSEKIPVEFAQDLGKFVESLSLPRSMRGVNGLMDSMLNVWKISHTGVFPQFHFRNKVSGSVANVLLGLVPVHRLLFAEKIAWDIMHGKTVKATLELPIVRQMIAERGLPATADNGTKMFRLLLGEHSVVGPFQGETLNRVGGAASIVKTAEDVMQQLPGHNPVSLRRAAKKVFGMTDDTKLIRGSVRGVGKAEKTTLGIVAAGEEFGHAIEGTNRIAPFFEQLRKGVDAAEAAGKVRFAQVAYKPHYYTKFEQQFLNRVFPFYKFQSSMIKNTITEMLRHPGGGVGQTIRGTSKLASSDPTTPEYVSDTASIPLGEAEDGTKRYLTSFGLMHEDPIQILGPLFAGNFMDVGRSVLGRTRPVLKGSAEGIFGQSTFQSGPFGGRLTSTMDPTIGRIISNIKGDTKPVHYKGDRTVEFLLGNSPVSRLTSSIRTLTDRRKGFLSKAGNLLTGIRVTDISPAQQLRATSNKLKKAELDITGARQTQDIYISAAAKKLMTPEQLARINAIQAARLRVSRKLRASRKLRSSQR